MPRRTKNRLYRRRSKKRSKKVTKKQYGGRWPFGSVSKNPEPTYVEPVRVTPFSELKTHTGKFINLSEFHNKMKQGTSSTSPIVATRRIPGASSNPSKHLYSRISNPVYDFAGPKSNKKPLPVDYRRSFFIPQESLYAKPNPKKKNPTPNSNYDYATTPGFKEREDEFLKKIEGSESAIYNSREAATTFYKEGYGRRPPK